MALSSLVAAAATEGMLWCMGILAWLKLFMWRRSMRCRGCGTPLQGFDAACSDACAHELEWAHAIR